MTFDSSRIEFYIDGIQVATTSTTSTPEKNTIPLRIGSDSRNIDDHIFTGSIDEVGVWSRVLDSNELTSLMIDGVFPTNGRVYFNQFNNG